MSGTQTLISSRRSTPSDMRARGTPEIVICALATIGSLLGWDMRASSLESGLLDPSKYAQIRP
jgi:hypothetical protein